MSASQALVNQLLNMNIGLTMDQIKNGIVATNNSTPEAAINWIFENPAKAGKPHAVAKAPAPAPAPKPKPAPSGSNSVPASKIKDLRSKMSQIGVANASEDLLTKAIQNTKGNLDEAVMWVLNNMHSQSSAPSGGAGKKKEEQKQQGPSDSDVQARKQALLDAAKERQAKKKEEDAKRAKFLAAEKRKAEMKALQEEKDAIERRDEMEVQTAANRKALEDRRKAETKKRQNKAIKDHIKRGNFVEKEQKEAEERALARKQLEARIKTPKACVEMMKNRYGVEPTRTTMLFISKVLKKITTNPKEKKFRSLDKEKAVVKDHLVIRVGGGLYLRLIGWRETETNFQFDGDAKKLEPVVKALEKRFAKNTGIDKLVGQMITSADATWIGLSLIHKHTENVLKSPSETTRMLDINKPQFKKWVGRNPGAVKIMKSLGWKIQKQGEQKFFVLAAVDVGLLKQALLDLNREMKKLARTQLRDIPIFRETITLVQSGVKLAKLKSLVLKILKRICDEPLNIRIQNLDKNKIASKIPGIIKLLLAFGFILPSKGHMIELKLDVATLTQRTRLYEACVDTACGS